VVVCSEVNANGGPQILRIRVVTNFRDKYGNKGDVRMITNLV